MIDMEIAKVLYAKKFIKAKYLINTIIGQKIMQ